MAAEDLEAPTAPLITAEALESLDGAAVSRRTYLAFFRDPEYEGETTLDRARDCWLAFEDHIRYEHMVGRGQEHYVSCDCGIEASVRLVPKSGRLIPRVGEASADSFVVAAQKYAYPERPRKYRGIGSGAGARLWEYARKKLLE